MKKNDRSKIIQLIHIAKSQIGLSDEDYREILSSVTKKSSCSSMSLFELNKVLDAMKQLGFSVIKPEAKEIELGWDTSKKQMDYIKGMWQLVARDKRDRALYSFINRIAGVRHPRFMDEIGAQKVIIALRKMMENAGLNPDYKEGYGRT
ncbi:regulatory protein GemA [Treponema pectinovorum]|uniref:regulatory protein GemA n=1 Tax=Treponema pectinovorum TaxID=164 RepID=UPI0011CA2425|nr:regulatory protein GemA [Treponema pectinovorum]